MFFIFAKGMHAIFYCKELIWGSRPFFTRLIVVGLIGWLKVSTEADSDIWGVLVIHVGVDFSTAVGSHLLWIKPCADYHTKYFEEVKCA